MRKFLWITLVGAIGAAIILPATTWCQQNQSTDTASTPQTIALGPGQTSASQQDSLGAAARKAREDKKEAAKSVKVFTNDDIPSTGGGVAKASTPDSAVAAAPSGDAGANASLGKDEKAWRGKFAQLHSKLERDKQAVEVMQRELGVLDLQYYNDPVKAMQQQLTRSDINEKTAKIEAKKKEIEADQQAIDDAEDDLRKAGGDPGWAR
jgi:chromosome segregation ATPase